MKSSETQPIHKSTTVYTILCIHTKYSTFKQVIILQIKEQVTGVLALRAHVVQVYHVHVDVVVKVPLTGLTHVADVVSTLPRFSWGLIVRSQFSE